MREILFRAKCIKTSEKSNLKGDSVSGKWVYGGILQGSGKHSIIYSLDPLDEYPVYSETVGQFTGLTDKNGKKIFEGDICKVNGLIYKVAFDYAGWRFKIISNKVYSYPAFHSHCGENCEIIGNIHDNPELLGDPNA